MIGLSANGISRILHQSLASGSFVPTSSDDNNDDGTNMVPSNVSSFQPVLRKHKAADQFNEI